MDCHLLLLRSATARHQNGHPERVIGSIRRECLDHIVILTRTIEPFAPRAQGPRRNERRRPCPSRYASSMATMRSRRLTSASSVRKQRQAAILAHGFRRPSFRRPREVQVLIARVVADVAVHPEIGLATRDVTPNRCRIGKVGFVLHQVGGRQRARQNVHGLRDAAALQPVGCMLAERIGEHRRLLSRQPSHRLLAMLSGQGLAVPGTLALSIESGRRSTGSACCGVRFRSCPNQRDMQRRGSNMHS